MTEAVEKYLNNLKEKSINEYSTLELSDEIEVVSEMYLKSGTHKDDKKALQAAYTKMVEEVHRRINRKTYKAIISRD